MIFSGEHVVSILQSIIASNPKKNADQIGNNRLRKMSQKEGRTREETDEEENMWEDKREIDTPRW
jgi:hypothetical protein